MPKGHSLRDRYLKSSALVAALLFLTSLGSYWYLNQTASRNSQALNTTERLTHTLSHTLSHLHEVVLVLHEQASAERADHPALLSRHMSLAQQGIAELMQARNPYYGDLNLNDLQTLLHTLSARLERYERLRNDLEWVYPTLPFLTDTLLQANRRFESQLALALNEVEQHLDQPDHLRLYRGLTELRSYWRRMILSFRAAMIRFAGLPDRDATNEEVDIAELHRQVMTELATLAANPLARDDLQVETSLQIMSEAALQWQADFARLREIRRTGQWRGDIAHINDTLLPLYRDIERVIDRLQDQASRLSQQAAAAFTAAANRLNLLLWLISGLGIVIIVALYGVLDRAILQPITRVAAALSDESMRHLPHQLPDNPNREIQQLTDAFQRMREQVHGRQLALEHQATHDVLTELPNRALLLDRIKLALATVPREHRSFAVLLLDLDRFKDINDSLGHQTGDQVLQQVARRLSALVRGNDTVARLGGDEFALVLPGMGRAQAVRFAKRIADSLSQPFDCAQHQLYTGVSIGIVIAPEEGDDPDTLIRLADNAMYSAKRNDREYAFFDAEHDRRMAAGVTLAAALQQELQAPTGLTMHYQPRLDTRSGRVTAVEALLRWQTGDGDWISPERILHAADHAHIQNTLSCWIFNRVIADCAQLNRLGVALRVSINVTAADAQDTRMPERLAALLDKFGVPASQLILEITENALLADPERARRILTQLSDQGLSVSIDDFGTGFSSLAHLRLLPVSELKIDRSFVLGMLDNDNDRAIVHSTIDLGHNLGLLVVAEGVEDARLQEQLVARRCDQLQGYHIGRPMPLEDLLASLGHSATA